MRQKAAAGATCDAHIERFNGGQKSILIDSPIRLGVWSVWDWEHWRKLNGIYELIDTWQEGNVTTTEGRTHMLGSTFSADTQLTTWYYIVFEDDYTPLVTNTYAVPGFTESTAYDESTRPQWQEAGAAAATITNSATKASFTFNDTKTIYGSALVAGGTDPNTKGNTGGGGVLFCSSQFTSGSKPVVSTDILKVSTSVSLADV
jgi:hypothetical protein